MRIIAAILAGGEASRLGRIAKGLLADAAGVSLIERLIGEAASAGIHEVVLSVNDPQPYLRFGKRLIADLHPGTGPLGGIEAVLEGLSGNCDSVLFLPCDLPNISARELTALLEAHRRIPDLIAMIGTKDNEHPLCAVVPVALRGVVSAAVRSGEYGVVRLWQRSNAIIVAVDDPSRLVNLNTPDDLCQWREGSERTQSGDHVV